MDSSFCSLIEDLIELKYEGEYWDFKQEWYSNKFSLLHDILCMANARHEGDRYIIIGVDDKQNICGIHGDTNRLKQRELIDFLREKEFANENRPEIVIQTIIIDDKEIDVVIVKDKPLKPYYVITDYQSIKAYHIYTRVGDTNTPKNKQADQYFIEQMWRERFGLDKSPMERLCRLLLNPDEWNSEKEEYHYHNLFPEFYIIFEPPTKIQHPASCDPYYYFYSNENGAYGNVKFYYHSTLLAEEVCIYCDEYRMLLPRPELEHSKSLNTYVYYYLMDTFKGSFLKYLRTPPVDYQGPEISPFSTGRFGYAPFLIFNTRNEIDDFLSFIDIVKQKDIHINNIVMHEEIINKNITLKKNMMDMKKIQALYNLWFNK